MNVENVWFQQDSNLILWYPTLCGTAWVFLEILLFLHKIVGIIANFNEKVIILVCKNVINKQYIINILVLELPTDILALC